MSAQEREDPISQDHWAVEAIGNKEMQNINAEE